MLSPTRLLMLLALIAAVAAPAGAQTAVKLDPSIPSPPFEGWGTSLAWWAHVIGGFPEPARSQYMKLVFDPIEGLGLTVVRYNIGGGENPAYDTLEYRADIPGYQPEPGRWDWAADTNQRWVLDAAKKLGADKVEAFSNSPPYWMTVSGSVTGSRPGNANNMDRKYDEQFAEYLVKVAQHFKQEWGTEFITLEPLNEPDGGWWKFGGRQEGSYFDHAAQNAILKATGAALRRSGLRTHLSSPDQNWVDAAVDAVRSFDPTAVGYLWQLNTHTYGGTRRVELYNLANSLGKRLWMSEYGDGDASGLPMSLRILQDIKQLRPTAWVYWQAVDGGGGWGFLSNPLVDQTTTAHVINDKYYVMANYSKFIRPGVRFIPVADDSTLAALDAKSRQLILVATNPTDAPRQVTYDLSPFTSLGRSAAPHRTGEGEKLKELPPVALRNKRLAATLPPKSVTTFVVDGAAYAGKPGIDPADYYTLTNRQSGLALDVNQGSLAGGADVVAWHPNRGPNQQWGLLAVGDGTYELVNRNSGLVLDVDRERTDAGVNVIQYPHNGGANQRWTLEKSGQFVRLLNTNSGLPLEEKNGAVTQGEKSNPVPVSQQWKLAKR